MDMIVVDQWIELQIKNLSKRNEESEEELPPLPLGIGKFNEASLKMTINYYGVPFTVDIKVAKDIKEKLPTWEDVRGILN